MRDSSQNAPNLLTARSGRSVGTHYVRTPRTARHQRAVWATGADIRTARDQPTNNGQRAPTQEPRGEQAYEHKRRSADLTSRAGVRTALEGGCWETPAQEPCGSDVHTSAKRFASSISTLQNTCDSSVTLLSMSGTVRKQSGCHSLTQLRSVVPFQ